MPRGAGHALYLIDAGLSPRRTRRLLVQAGLGELPIEGVLLTHLDHDHWYPGWLNALPDRATVHLHRRHRGRAERLGLTYLRTRFFEDDVELTSGVVARPVLNHHDDLGTVAYRVEFPGGGALGFATDVGRCTQELVEHLRGVDVLAIESNYCPAMQLASARPDFLKQRIMGGKGHLSNQQSARAVRGISPRRHVVLLHLSLECNTPETALAHHDHADVLVTISASDTPTPVIAVTPGESGPARSRQRTARTLFG